MLPVSPPSHSPSLAARAATPLWLGGLALVAAGVMAVALARHVVVEGDTEALVAGAEGVRRCLAEGRLSGCTEAQKWPLLQTVPSVALRALGVGAQGTALALCYLNLAAFAALLAATWRTLAVRSRAVGLAGVLVLASGPWVAYAHRSFGELLAAALTLGFAAAWLGRARGAAVGALAFFAALSKETSFPFLGLLGLACVAALRAPGEAWGAVLRAERGRLVSAGVGLAAALGLSAAFNLFRFGLPYNVTYLREAQWAPAPAMQAELFAALWVSPNAGLLFFWPLGVVTLGALAVRARREGGWALAGVGLLLLGVTVLLARWWAPFGWWAWGSRLVLPWLPAALLVALWACAEPAERLARAVVASRARAMLLALLTVAVAAPHVVAAFRPHELNAATFVDRGVCPVPDPPENYELYYRCIRAQAWEHPSPLGTALGMIGQPRPRNSAFLYAVLLGLGVVALRRAAHRPGGRAARSP
ncbi:MAG: hypothetical protein JXB05_20980 [Myxococcaceae bacterium]|nr:hypothetical protein [Myxococcaceae bacterium]